MMADAPEDPLWREIRLMLEHFLTQANGEDREEYAEASRTLGVSVESLLAAELADAVQQFLERWEDRNTGDPLNN